MWTIAFGKSGEEPYRETNVFTEVDRPRRIVFDSIMAMGEEGRDKGGRDFGTNVTVTFEDRDGKTLLTIVQTGYENENHRDGVLEDGWPRILDALERVVAERRSTWRGRRRRCGG